MFTALQSTLQPEPHAALIWKPGAHIPTGQSQQGTPRGRGSWGDSWNVQGWEVSEGAN